MLNITLDDVEARALFEVLRDLESGQATLERSEGWGPDFTGPRIAAVRPLLRRLLPEVARHSGSRLHNGVWLNPGITPPPAR